MAYCTQSDIEKCLEPNALIYITDDAGSGTVDAAKVAEAVLKAGSEIDAYCQVKYSVPFSPVPDLVKSLAEDIAVYNLFARRGFKENTADKAIMEKYKNAIALLRDIAKGLAAVGTGTIEEPVAPPEMVVRTRTKIFDEETLEYF